MNRIIIAVVMVVMGLMTGSALADDLTVEQPKSCDICGMDRQTFAQSRVVIVYADGTSSGFCSITCTAGELRKSGYKLITSFRVADYSTSELTDAGKATWVVGGHRPGVMTSQAKWAFAKEDTAQKFITQNGGKLATFDEVMKSAYDEAGKSTGHDHSIHMGPGANMVFNPAFGDDIYHTHPAGMWMTNYKFMHMGMNGLKEGSTTQSLEAVSPSAGKPRYMMTPTDMTMDMQMFMIMYGITDRLTVMGMGNYLTNSMDMVMNMGMGKGNVPQAAMRTSGFSDTELRGIYKINEQFNGSLGLSLPTGDIRQEIEMMGMKFRAPYDMQLGSGTFDLKPALTYSDVSGDALWNWGGQAGYTYHLGHNDAGYSLGDSLKLTSWLQRAMGPAATWLRLSYTNTARISGQDSEITNSLKFADAPDAETKNYGGDLVNAFIGASYTKGAFSAGIEAGLPLYQYVNGLQMANTWNLTAAFQVMF
jgi:nitrous oxide reductase accessory protein NosL